METNQPVISVIVPCYNHAVYLDEALESVLNQTFKNWECIIVDDGSSDNTEEVAKKWTVRDSRFKYVKKENGGLASARNFGISISKGIYILPLDSDDIIHENYLNRLLPELLNNPELAIASCYSKFFRYKKNNIVHELKPSGSSIEDLMYENIMIATSLFRKECWEEVGGYDENMKSGFEDWEFWIAITKRGWKFKFIQEFLFYYRKSKNSMLVDTITNHFEENIEYVFKKHKEIYIENFDTTLFYLLFLLKRSRNKEKKIKSSFEYRVARIIAKPFKILKII